MSIRIIEIKDQYIDFLKNYFFSTMMDNKPGRRIHSRKYIGILLTINNYNYFAPLSSPKDSDYMEDGTIRNSSKVILRMVANSTTQPKLLGTIKLNNMIPVPKSEIIDYDISLESDTKYRDLLLDELKWIQRNTERIKKSANKLYNIKIKEELNRNDSNSKFYDSIMPFLEAEVKCDEYTNLNKNRNVK